MPRQGFNCGTICIMIGNHRKSYDFKKNMEKYLNIVARKHSIILE